MSALTRCAQWQNDSNPDGHRSARHGPGEAQHAGAQSSLAYRGLLLVSAMLMIMSFIHYNYRSRCEVMMMVMVMMMIVEIAVRGSPC